jgi:hypothetical protein
MSTERDVNRIVRSWLDDGVNVLPDRVLDAVLDQLPATPQRRASWLARRFSVMNNSTLRLGLAAAAAVVIAIIGVGLLVRPGGIGGPTPTATPIPTPAPTLPPAGTLAPGSYRSDFITLTVPAGWTSEGGWNVSKNGANPPNGMSVNPWKQITTVPSDPCHWQTTSASVGASVDALVTALVAQPGGGTAAPVDVTIDGFQGKKVDLMVPLDENLAACDVYPGDPTGIYVRWTAADGGQRYNQGPGQHDIVDILDVNGTTLVVHATYYAANTAADRAELQAIIDSITITP